MQQHWGFKVATFFYFVVTAFFFVLAAVAPFIPHFSAGTSFVLFLLLLALISLALAYWSIRVIRGSSSPSVSYLIAGLLPVIVPSLLSQGQGFAFSVIFGVPFIFLALASFAIRKQRCVP